MLHINCKTVICKQDRLIEVKKDSWSYKFNIVVEDALDKDRWRQIIRSRCNPNAVHDPEIDMGFYQRE